MYFNLKLIVIMVENAQNRTQILRLNQGNKEYITIHRMKQNQIDVPLDENYSSYIGVNII